MSNADLFAPWFKDRSSWSNWFIFLKALFGLRLSKAELAVYKICTGRTDVRPGGFFEAAVIVGRRGGKSLILALAAVFLACFRTWRQHLSPGERGCIMIIAADKKQARVIYRYIRAFLTEVPALSLLIERETADAIDLKNGITIEILAANFRTLRGYTVIACLADEIAFWRTDLTGSNPDTEILASIRPSMGTVPSAMLLLASSPYAKRGVLWETHRRYFGQDGAPVLVWQAGSRVMNPSLCQHVIDSAIERDPAGAASEFGAMFRSDISGFLEPELVTAATDGGVIVRPPIPGAQYRAHCDASGGAHDAFTIAIAHSEGDAVILDCAREWLAPFNPSSVVAEAAALLLSYGLLDVQGDHYSMRWVVESFAKVGVVYSYATRDRSAIYLDFLPLMTSGRVRLLDIKRLSAQLSGLERHVSPAGRDRVEPGPLHDDLGVSCAGAVVAAAQRPAEIVSSMPWVTGGNEGRRTSDFDEHGRPFFGPVPHESFDVPPGW